MQGDQFLLKRSPFFVGCSQEDSRALALSIPLLGVFREADTPATFAFHRLANPEKAWQLWLEEWFEPTLGPGYTDIFLAAQRFHIRELERMDVELAAKLRGNVLARGREAGELFFDGKAQMRGCREWSYYAAAVSEGRAPGLVTSAHAVQAALYSLPVVQSLQSYLEFELHCGIPAKQKHREEHIRTCLNAADSSLRKLFRDIPEKFALKIEGVKNR